MVSPTPVKQNIKILQRKTIELFRNFRFLEALLVNLIGIAIKLIGPVSRDALVEFTTSDTEYNTSEWLTKLHLSLYFTLNPTIVCVILRHLKSKWGKAMKAT